MFKLYDTARVKVLNEKKSYYILNNLFKVKLSADDFFEKVITSNRIKNYKLEIKIVVSKNKLNIIYTDIIKYDVSKIDRFFTDNDVISGSLNRAISRLIKSKKIKGLYYKSIDESNSCFEVLFDKKVNEKDYIFKKDISEYLIYDNELFFSITQVYNEFKEKSNVKDDDLKEIVMEFLLNILQHGFRKHGKYIEIEREVICMTVGRKDNVIFLLGDKFIYDDVRRRIENIADEGHSEVIFNFKRYSGDKSDNTLNRLSLLASNENLKYSFDF